jgi:chemotaxis protein histidine kinase CheA
VTIFVRQLGGTITATAEPGAGTTIKVSFPFALTPSDDIEPAAA